MDRDSIWFRVLSSEWYGRLERLFIDSWYYPIKDFLFPWHTLRIRNLPRSYQEPSERVFHAVFTILCQHIDGNEGGREKFVARIADHASRLDEPNTKAWHDAYVEMLAAYDFYNSINWENPSGFDWDAYGKKHISRTLEMMAESLDDEASAAVKKDDEIREQGNQIIASVIKTHGFWWS